MESCKSATPLLSAIVLGSRRDTRAAGEEAGIDMRIRDAIRSGRHLESIARVALVGAAAALLVLLGATFAFATGVTSLVSVGSDGVQGNDFSYAPGISADGRYVVFESGATNLVATDVHGVKSVYVRDLLLGTTEIVSVDSSGVPGNDFSDCQAISADGRFVAFRSQASNLVPDDTNGVTDIFVHDRVLGTTQRVSVSSSGEQGNAEIYYTPTSLSADGRYVAFGSTASNLTPHDVNGHSEDVFVRDVVAGTTELVSADAFGDSGNGWSIDPAISADGRYVAFRSEAANLVPDDTNGASDAFVRDRLAGTTERVSVNSAGEQANSAAWSPGMSADGRFVAFGSVASNLTPDDANDCWDVFVRDRETSTTSLASVSTWGGSGNSAYPANNWTPVISDDGRYVAFGSTASGLVPGDTNGIEDVFVRDRLAGITERLTVGLGSEQGSGNSPAISADGRWVVYRSYSPNLVEGDTNSTYDVFLADRSLDEGAIYVQTPQPGSTLAYSSVLSFRPRIRAISGGLKTHKVLGSYPVRIYRWRLVRKKWKAAGYVTASVRASGRGFRYSSRVAFNHPGRWRLRARCLATKQHPAAWSNGYIYITIK